MSVPALETFFVKRHYKPRIPPDSPRDATAGQPGIGCPPDLHPFAAFLARRYGCTHVVAVGCGRGEELAHLYPDLEIVAIEWDHEQGDRPRVPDAILARSVIVCANVIERLVDPRELLDALRSWLDLAPVCLLATPERDLASGSDDNGPPVNPAHVREWTLTEFEKLLQAEGLSVAFVGLTVTNDRDWARETILAVLERTERGGDGRDVARLHAPPSFRATAIVPAYNEQDVIAPSLRRLIEQGLDVYVIDNWSTDDTYEIAAQFAGRGLIGIERLPAAGPAPYYDWRAILRRVEELSLEIESDWFLFQSVDEVRKTPWPEVSLRDAFYRLDADGFNAVDFTVAEFHPIANGYMPGSDFEAYFRHFDFGKHPAHSFEINAWKHLGVRPVLAESGGHEAAFEGRRIYPFKFLLKHYSVRSQEHGERKVLRERQPRWSPAERADGWHSHYDHVVEGHSFLRDPRDLWVHDEHFERQFLVERLSGVGVLRPATRRLSAAEVASELRSALAELECEARSRYGKLRHRYLLPLYRRLGLDPNS